VSCSKYIEGRWLSAVAPINVIQQTMFSCQNIPSITVIRTSSRMRSGYLSLALRAAHEILLLLPGESLGMSAGCIVNSMKRNFLTKVEIKSNAFTSLFNSRASIARYI
jgi:hypothetical protein